MRGSSVAARSLALLNPQLTAKERWLMADGSKPVSAPAYRRVVLKVSGEGLCRTGSTGIDADEMRRIAGEIKSVVEAGVELCLVIGGGNIIRGGDLAERIGIEEVAAHYMGMLGTVINAIAIQEILEAIGVTTRVQSAIQIDRICERFVRRRALRHLEKGRLVIFAAGTGNPFQTTDSCAALRASEIGADLLLKATKVDGVFTADPAKHADARRLDRLGYNEFIDRRLGVMDLAAVVMCQQNRIPIVVFNLKESGHMRSIVMGGRVGTVVGDDSDT